MYYVERSPTCNTRNAEMGYCGQYRNFKENEMKKKNEKRT